MDTTVIWNCVRALIKNEVSSVMYSIWIEPMQLESLTEDKAVLTVPTIFKKDIIQEKFSDIIKKAFAEVVGFSIEMTFVVKSAPSAKHKNDPFYYRIVKYPLPEERERIITNIKKDVFDNFPVSENNKTAYTAALEVSQNPGVTHNPLFIHGGSDDERTLLINAIINYIAEHNPTCNFVCKIVEEYISEIVSDIKRHTEKFTSIYMNADYLLLDGINLIERVPVSIQERFISILKKLLSENKQIVIFSDIGLDDIPFDNGELLDLLKNSYLVSMDGN